MSGSAESRSARQYAPGRLHRIENTVMNALTRAGAVPHSYVLTTRGRRTGRPRHNPVLIDRRWPVAPYGAVGWVHNARAAGRVRPTRRRTGRDYLVREVSGVEAGPVCSATSRSLPRHGSTSRPPATIPSSASSPRPSGTPSSNSSTPASAEHHHPDLTSSALTRQTRGCTRRCTHGRPADSPGQFLRLLRRPVHRGGRGPRR
ncbi:nitroreductase/quinone reductase family protein [Nocardia rhamnosiphila]